MFRIEATDVTELYKKVTVGTDKKTTELLPVIESIIKTLICHCLDFENVFLQDENVVEAEALKDRINAEKDTHSPKAPTLIGTKLSHDQLHSLPCLLKMMLTFTKKHLLSDEFCTKISGLAFCKLQL